MYGGKQVWFYFSTFLLQVNEVSIYVDVLDPVKTNAVSVVM